MKKHLIAALVCVNIILLAALLLGTTVRNAEAQAKGPVIVKPGPAYMSCTGRVAKDDREAIFILDLRTHRVAGIGVDTAGGKVVLKEIRGPNLRR
ncbi:MAG TPA: hypothetical protein ENL03_06055 [Phycisphaerae bacterium]|nr:hypothetical protein [Phycisphaerae bacterium]